MEINLIQGLGSLNGRPLIILPPCSFKKVYCTLLSDREHDVLHSIFLEHNTLPTFNESAAWHYSTLFFVLQYFFTQFKHAALD